MLFRIFKYSIKNIFRNKFLSISSVLVLTLLMLCVNLLFVFQWVLFSSIEKVNSKLTISLFLKDKYSFVSDDITSLTNSIKSIDDEISVDFKSKEEALEELKEKNVDLRNIFRDVNPLPNSINISNISLWDYETLNETITNRQYILHSDIWSWIWSSYSSQYDRINSLVNIIDSIRYFIFILLLLFLFSIGIIIYSIINNFIYHYREEINITKLVWWWDIFIFWPFVMQWIFYSLAWFIISFFLFELVLSYSSWISQTLWFNITEVFSWKNLILFVVEMIIFSLIWAISAYISSNKFTKNAF